MNSFAFPLENFLRSPSLPSRSASQRVLKPNFTFQTDDSEVKFEGNSFESVRSYENIFTFLQNIPPSAHSPFGVGVGETSENKLFLRRQYIKSS